MAQNKGVDRKSKESACRAATEEFLRTLWPDNPSGIAWNKANDPDDCLHVIARCARLLAALRGAINVWYTDEGGEKLSHNVPVIEKPHRINCLLYNLARGHALICGRRQLTNEDLWPGPRGNFRQRTDNPREGVSPVDRSWWNPEYFRCGGIAALFRADRP